jgi:hypothetical protein
MGLGAPVVIVHTAIKPSPGKSAQVWHPLGCSSAAVPIEGLVSAEISHAAAQMTNEGRVVPRRIGYVVGAG